MDQQRLAQKVQDLTILRADTAFRLAVCEKIKVNKILEYFDNDYTLLAQYYQKTTGRKLISSPYESMLSNVAITKNCSIVIPTYNNSALLKNCLIAIQHSTFNAKYPSQLEVIVVDDGSPDENISQKVKGMSLSDLNLRVYRQTNGRVGKARYSGVINSRHEIILITDPDIIYTPNTIEEYMKRHSLLTGVVFFGLRHNIEPLSVQLTRPAIRSGILPSLDLNLYLDPRVMNSGLRESNWLIRGGHNQPLRPHSRKFPTGLRLASVAWGSSVSASRVDLLRTYAGYDERYAGWGGDDEDMVSRLIALGNFIIPNTGGFCYHQNHPLLYEKNKHEINLRVLDDNLNSPLKVQDPGSPNPTDAKLVLEIKNPRTFPIHPEPSKIPIKHAKDKIDQHLQEPSIFKILKNRLKGILQTIASSTSHLQ